VNVIRQDGSFFHPQPELDKAADGLGTRWQIVLLSAPVIQSAAHVFRQAH
jgi:hypothetical protein